MGWVLLFKNVANPVIAYFGSVQYLFYFESVRKRYLNATNLSVVEIPDLHMCTMKSNMTDSIANTTGNTTGTRPNATDYASSHAATQSLSADILCTMHAKYELLKRAAQVNPYRTSHMLWVDVGSYNAPSRIKPRRFSVNVPKGSDNQRVSYWASGNTSSNRNLSDVFREQAVWLDGNFVFGTTQTLITWSDTYMSAVANYLRHNQVGTDETSLYAMMLDTQYKYRDRVKIYSNGTDPQFSELRETFAGVKIPMKGI